MLHKKKICIGDLCRLVVELNYFQLSQLPQFTRDIKKKNYLQVANSLVDYQSSLQQLLQKQHEKAERRKYKKELIKQLEEDDVIFDDNYISLEMSKFVPSCKLPKDSVPEIVDLVTKGLKIETMKNVRDSIDQLKKAITGKLTNIMEDTFKFADDLKKQREQVLVEEHNKFLQAKKLGIKSVIDFKATKFETQRQVMKTQYIANAEIDDARLQFLQNIEQENSEKSATLNYAKESIAKVNLSIARCKDVIARAKKFGLGERDDFYSAGLEDTYIPGPHGKLEPRNIAECKDLIRNWENEKKHLRSLAYHL
jgi:hypothetical protein